MHFLLKRTGKWFLLLALLAVAGSSRAQTVTILKKVLDGSNGRIAKDSSVTVQDSAYFDIANQNKLDTPYSVKNIITFKINEYAGIILPDTFTATVQVRIIYIRPDWQTDSIETTLSLNYQDTATYTSRSSFVFNNAHQVKVKILSVAITAASNILPALVLENEMDVQPAYILSCTGDAVTSIHSNNPPDTDSTDEIRVDWPTVTGADVYDLEWTYIDSSALTSRRYGTPINPSLLFLNNTTRVTVANNAYSIPLMYDNGGILFYRVRAVQEKERNVRLETAWSSATTTGLGQYSFGGHQRALNWQSTISFAEDGKRKVVVQYYDGSLRSRQTVTKDNSTNTVVVAETMYDYQGRPVIQVLPAPTLKTAIKYFSNFNTALNGAEYDKENYDHLESPSAFLTTSANAMSTVSGANNYYSPANPEKDNGFNRFIPDAGGYAFTETSYTQDNTGRISRQSGVGPVHKLGSNHETVYMYGSPGETDLDYIFGTSAGDKSHYFKNLVQDANGEMSVAYVDMHGRTIATAIASTTDSSNLSSIYGISSIYYSDTLSRAGSNVIRDLVRESSQSQLVTVNSDYKFKYALNTPVLRLSDCNNNTVNYIVRYDLEIKITDDANNQRLGGKPFDTIFRNYTPGTDPTFTLNIIPTPQNIKDSFTIYLTKGNYEISKRLTINQEALAYYRDSVFMKRNVCTTLEQFIQQQRDLLQNAQCIPDCEACKANIATWEIFRSNYMTQAGIAVTDSALYRSEALNAYNETVATCDALCGTTSAVTDVRNALLLDVSAPSGQYANPDDTLNVYSIFYHRNEKILPPYQRDSIVYLDEQGRKDTVYDPETNTFVIPQQLSPEQFATQFKSSWADALLKFHPEYCKYLKFLTYSSSYNWDRLFETSDTYADAKSKGYLNPTGNSTYPFTIVSGNKDPLANTTPMKNALEASLNNFKSSSLSMWSVSAITVKCPGYVESCYNLYNTPATAFNEGSMCTGDLDMAWRSFRQLYLTTKHDLLNTEIDKASCAGITKVTAAQLVAAGNQPNFNTVSAVLSQQGLSYLGDQSKVSANKDSIRKQLLQSYADNCNSYVSAWVSQLAPCNYDTNDLNNIIIPRLLAICKEGADSAHPYGSSSVNPASTNTYKNFQEVLDEYNTQHNITDPLTCNSCLVTAPAPYDKQPAYVNQIVYSKPDSCQCSKLNNLWQEYLANGLPSDGSFAGYLARTRNTIMTDADLTQLLNSCNTTSSCTYLEKEISLPPALQCNMGEICVTCNTIDTLYNQYVNKYPSYLPTKEETDTTQQKKNQLFANYMNYQLGFAKQAWEYLSFREQCQQNTNFPARVSSSSVAYTCTQLTSIKQQFQELYPTGNLLSVSKTVPLTDVIHIYNQDESVAVTATAALAAATGTNSAGWYTLRDNVKFGFNVVAKDAVISNATMNLYAKPDQIEVYSGTDSAHRNSSNVDSVYGYFERALGTVTAGTTTWDTQPAVTTTNRLTIGPLPHGYSNADYLNLPCTALVKDMFNNYLNNNDNGVIFRLSKEAEDAYKAFIFWSNADTTIAQPATININYSATRCEEFTAYFNTLQQTSYTSSQLTSLYQSVCGSSAGVCDTSAYPNYDGLLLCGKSNAIFSSIKDSINNCSDSSFFSFSKGYELYNAYRDSLKGRFDAIYIDTSLNGANRELFTVNYYSYEYQTSYTLYYYDQAGNLVRTVPPAGVYTTRSSNWVPSVNLARATNTTKTPPHTMTTEYRYNTLNQVIRQSTPDAGISNFWYDRLGRLAISQNAKQALVNAYSYTNYDALGRITEVGEITSSTAMTTATSRDETLLAQWLANAAATRTQITYTTYDIAYPALPEQLQVQHNLRNRVSWTALYNTAAAQSTGQFATATFYSYDIHGNVDTLLQDYKQGAMADAGNRFKKLVYHYDLVSGKVNEVAFQPGNKDAFYHRYSYDAENRITHVETSHDNIYWENDAYYQYYKHGPLARTVLGQQQVQGIDNAYTLQGWLKGVNSNTVTPKFDMGKDGAFGSQVAKDVFGFSLTYYYNRRDYSPIGTLMPFVFVTNVKPLYNGNITAICQSIPSLGTASDYTYYYDMLNRMTGMQVSKGLDTATNTWKAFTTLTDFKELVTYDHNGNISTYQRNGNSALPGGLPMDKLTYTYKTGTNRLDFVYDSVPATNYDNDIDAQSAGNFGYDAIGNITSDTQGGIDSIKWTVYGKISRIKKTDGTVIDYTYDVAGNRISKSVNGLQTWYVRDATGNIMSVYTKGNNTHLIQTETNLFGSSRLGITTLNTDVEDTTTTPLTSISGLGSGLIINFIRGKKFFELNNHLGNVLATVSDKRTAVSVNGSIIDHYEADIVSAQEYYPFGMLMPGRSFNSNKYRYGFNGKENDNEVKGEGNQQDYGFRIYDPRLGRFLSVDPLTPKYPELTPYQFASNRPIDGIDLDGLEFVSIKEKENPDIYKAGVNNKDQSAVHIYAHGTPNNIQLKNGSWSNNPSDFKAILEGSDAYKNANNAENTVVIIHSCRTGRSYTDENGNYLPSYAEKMSAAFPKLTIIAPDERDMFNENGEQGPRKIKDPLNLRGDYKPKAEHTTTDEKGQWNVFKGGKLVGSYNDYYDPSSAPGKLDNLLFYTPNENTDNTKALVVDKSNNAKKENNPPVVIKEEGKENH